MTTTFGNGSSASSVPSAPAIFREEIKVATEKLNKKKDELLLMREQYRLNAQRKKSYSERKAKQGSEKKLENYKREIAGFENKASNDKREADLKVDKLEGKLKKLKDDYEATLALLEAKMERLKRDYLSDKEALETKIKMEEKIKSQVDERVEERMTSYYRPILDSLLEPEELEEEIKMPPSYDKIVAEIQHLENTIASKTKILKIVEEAEAAPEPSPSSYITQSQEKLRMEADAALERKFAADEDALRKRREQAKREAAEEEKQRKQREEADRLERLEELERRRESEKAAEATKETPKMPTLQERERELKKLKRHVEEMRKAEEYKMNPPSDAESAAPFSDSDDEEEVPKKPQKESSSQFPPVLGNTKRTIKLKKTK